VYIINLLDCTQGCVYRPNIILRQYGKDMLLNFRPPQRIITVDFRPYGRKITFTQTNSKRLYPHLAYRHNMDIKSVNCIVTREDQYCVDTVPFKFKLRLWAWSRGTGVAVWPVPPWQWHNRQWHEMFSCN